MIRNVDALVLGGRFRPWLDAQLVGRRLTADLMLGQGGPPLPSPGQEQYQTSVGLFAPGFQG